MLNRRCVLALLLLVLVGCDMRFGTPPTATPAPTELPPAPVAVVVWAQDGNLYAWQPDAPAPRLIAQGAVIQPYLSPSGARVAFTRGAQGDALALWSVGVDGMGEAELAPPDLIPSIRDGHPQINAVAWLDESSLDDQTIYFNTRQDYPSGSVRDDNLYRAQVGAAPRLILPPGAGGDFALSPDGQQIAVTTAGACDMQKERVTLLEDADSIEHIPDSTVTPAPMLPYLASWIGVETIDDSQPEALQRRIVSGAAKTLTWRGTARGLSSYLELITEGPARVEEGGGIWRAGDAPEDTAWVVMRVESTGLLELDDFIDVVRDEVPAHVRAELYVGPDRVWTSEEEWPG